MKTYHRKIIVQGCNGLLKVGVTADAKVFGAPRSQKKIGLTCHLCTTRKAFLLGELLLPEIKVSRYLANFDAAFLQGRIPNIWANICPVTGYLAKYPIGYRMSDLIYTADTEFSTGLAY